MSSIFDPAMQLALLPRVNMTLLQTAIACAASFWLIQTAYLIFLHPLRDVPGPRLAKFSQSWRNYRYFRGTWHNDIVELHRKYGPVVRIAPNEVSFVDKAALKVLYGHGEKHRKTRWYNSFTFPDASVSFFVTQDVQLHRKLRSRVTGVYNMTASLAVEPIVKDMIDTCLEKLEGLAAADSVVPLDKFVAYWAFDNVGELAMGGPLGFLERGGDVDGLMEALHSSVFLMANIGNMPLQTRWLSNRATQWLIRRFGTTSMNSFATFMQWLAQRVDARMAHGLPPGHRRDMLQHFVEMKDAATGLPVSRADVLAESVNILGAGADTTVFAILTTLGDLLQHPSALERVRREIDAAFCVRAVEKQWEGDGEGDGEGEGAGAGGDVSLRDADRLLPFLLAAVKESTRLQPSVQYQMPRYAPKEGVQLKGFFVPEDTICGISPTAMNRSEESFGADASEWRPERWVVETAEDEERVKKMNNLHTAFGLGSRSCTGKNIAMVGMVNFIARFLRRFDVELVNPEEPWKVRSMWFSFKTDFNVRLKRREVE